MKRAIGLVELKSIPAGIQAADEMLKAAEVELILANPVCPGKYVIIVSGDVAAVKASVNAGKESGSVFIIESQVIPNIHEDVCPAITATADYEAINALGSLESMSALQCILAGDIIAKAAQVSLIEIRIARGLGGKSFVLFTGDTASVKQALDACLKELAEEGSITSAIVIPNPHPSLIPFLL